MNKKEYNKESLNVVTSTVLSFSFRAIAFHLLVFYVSCFIARIEGPLITMIISTISFILSVVFAPDKNTSLPHHQKDMSEVFFESTSRYRATSYSVIVLCLMMRFFFEGKLENLALLSGLVNMSLIVASILKYASKGRVFYTPPVKESDPRN